MAHLMSIADRMELENLFMSIVTRNEPTKTDEDDHPQCEYCGRFSEDHTKQFICNECDVCYFCNNTGDRSVGCACCEKEVKSLKI